MYSEGRARQARPCFSVPSMVGSSRTPRSFGLRQMINEGSLICASGPDIPATGKSFLLFEDLEKWLRPPISLGDMEAVEAQTASTS